MSVYILKNMYLLKYQVGFSQAKKKKWKNCAALEVVVFCKTVKKWYNNLIYYS